MLTDVNDSRTPWSVSLGKGEELTTEGDEGLPRPQREKVVLNTAPAVVIFYLSQFDYDELGQLAKTPLRLLRKQVLQINLEWEHDNTMILGELSKLILIIKAT
jgi:hypothetical protein